MGEVRPQFVIGLVVGDSPEKKELDAFVAENHKLFTKSEELTNGHINYVMFWDGSKEHWDDSDEGDELRAKFIWLLGGIEGATWYEMVHYMDTSPKVSYHWVKPGWAENIHFVKPTQEDA